MGARLSIIRSGLASVYDSGTGWKLGEVERKVRAGPSNGTRAHFRRWWEARDADGNPLPGKHKNRAEAVSALLGAEVTP